MKDINQIKISDIHIINFDTYQYNSGQNKGISIEYCIIDKEDDIYGKIDLFQTNDERSLPTWYYQNDTYDDPDKKLLNMIFTYFLDRTKYEDITPVHRSLIDLSTQFRNDIGHIVSFVHNNYLYKTLINQTIKVKEYLYSDLYLSKLEYIDNIDNISELIEHYQGLREIYIKDTNLEFYDPTLDDVIKNDKPSIQGLEKYLDFMFTWLDDFERDLNRSEIDEGIESSN